ncbi:ABC transporter substrate binding protein [Desulfonema limicola]|nr:ABC transporter substrate binding protein [Desulfonema limicola]
MKLWSKLFILTVSLVLMLNFSALAADKGNFSTKPTTNNGKKWRIGYFEGGEYNAYQYNMVGIINGLMSTGWIEQTAIPPQTGEQTKYLWQWLGNNAKSQYIEFVQDAHYSGNWNDETIGKIVSDIINRLNNTKDIDLMIAAGTKAGLGIANDKHHTSTIVISTTDPLSAGIIKSIQDSGYDHIHARVDPYRHERQINIFHDIIGFKKLGMAYLNTDQGRSFASFDSVKKISEKRDFEIVSCYTTDESPNVKDDEESVKKCFHELGKKVDAIYVTAQNGVNQNSIPELVKIAHQYKIPTFSQTHSDEVKYGFLMSVSSANYSYVGEFYAKTIAKIFNGAKPRQLDQVFEGPPKIAINLKTAEIIGYDPPVDVLSAADEMFQEITTPKKD